MRTLFFLILGLTLSLSDIELQIPATSPYNQYIPVFSMDRDLIAFTNYPHTGVGLYSVGVIQADGTSNRTLTLETDSSSPSWSRDGTSIVFVTAQGLTVMNADGSEKTLILSGGEPVHGNEPDWSNASNLIVFSDSEINVVDLDKSELYPIPGTASGWNSALSPDGTRLAYTTYIDGFRQITIQNLDGTGKYILPNTPGEVYQPAWSPDGEWIAFPANFGGNIDIYRIHPGGSGLEQITDTPWPILESQPTWSPDGKRIAFTSNDQEKHTFDIFVINVDGSGPYKLVTSAIDPDWSP